MGYLNTFTGQIPWPKYSTQKYSRVIIDQKKNFTGQLSLIMSFNMIKKILTTCSSSQSCGNMMI